MESTLQFHTYTRSGDNSLEEPYEEPAWPAPRQQRRCAAVASAGESLADPAVPFTELVTTR